MPEVSLEKIFSAVTHDLRQPLQALVLYLDALDRRTEREDARQILGKARAAADALSDQLDALSLHSKLSRLDISAHRESVTAQDIANAVLKVTGDTPLALTLPTPDARLKTDLSMISQILRALTENALRHGGGTAALEIKPENSGLVARVSDHGAGIPPQDRERAFQPFVKLQAGGEGLGLGLSNAAALAALLGATIEIEDNPGGGAVFTLRLPSSV